MSKTTEAEWRRQAIRITRAVAIEDAARVCDAAFNHPPPDLTRSAIVGWQYAADHIRIAIRALPRQKDEHPLGSGHFVDPPNLGKKDE